MMTHRHDSDHPVCYSLFLIYIWTIVIDIDLENRPSKFDEDTLKNEVERANIHYKHADVIFHQRFNFFMVAESMLIISFTYTLNEEIFSPISLSIGMLGILFSFSWLYTNARLSGRISYIIEEYMIKKDRVFFDYAKHSARGLYAGTTLSYLLPIGTIIFWIFIVSYTQIEDISIVFQIVFSSFILIILFSYYIYKYILFFRKNT